MAKPILAFVHINKTAGTTFQFILKNSFVLGHCAFGNVKNVEIAREKHLKLVKKFFPNLKCIAGHRIVEPTTNLGKNILPFTIIREPIARCASHYAGAFREGRTNLSFKEWIENPGMQNRQVRMIAGEPDLKKAVKLLKEKYFFVGLFEKFNESVQIFQALSPFEITPAYQSKNVREKNALKDELLGDEENMKLLKKYNALDIKLYKTVEKDIYPELLEKARPKFVNLTPPKEIRMPFKVWLTNVYNQIIFRRLSRLFIKD